MTQSLAQKRACDALEKIKAIEELPYGNYAAYVKALPANIILSGLGQALAMEKEGSRKGAPSVSAGHKLLYCHLDDWLRRGWSSGPYYGLDREDILEAIVKGSEDDYIRAQSEAMAYLDWLKKFAGALLKSPDAATGAVDESEQGNADEQEGG